MKESHSHRAPEGAPPPWRTRVTEVVRHWYSTRRTRGPVWRVLTPAVFLIAGALFVTSAISSGGTDLRPGRYDDLADLVRERSDRAAALSDQRARLLAEIDRLTQGLSGSAIGDANKRVDELRGPAGLEAVSGPGVTITLNDAPATVLDDGTEDVNRKLVHQQDIQAVVNAMWAGGAEAVTVQGQRIVTTTGIRCVGNSVLLHGVAYSPPYVIAGIGDIQQMLSRIQNDPYLTLYLRDVQKFQLGWQVDVSNRLDFPAYDGPTEMEYARPLNPDGGA